MLEVETSINISSLRDEELPKTFSLRKQEAVGLLRSGTRTSELSKRSIK
jgi:hypothetical protein